MVVALIIALAVVVAVALLCFKGVTIRYDKHFTINDKRNQHSLTEAQLQHIEDLINQTNTPPSRPGEDDEPIFQGSMDKVIENIHDLFGPETNK